MSFKRLTAGLALTLALAAAVPPSLASAITMAEIYNYSGSSTGSSTGDVLGVTAYSPVTVTSPTNLSLKVTVVPLIFSNGKWSYQIEWSRTRDAVGSLYISLKADRSQSILSIDNAARTGSSIFNADPSTSYVLEFYSQPLKKGVLLLRKTLKTRPAETSGSTSQDNSSANLPDGSSTAGLLLHADPSSITKFNYLGERIGAGLASSGAMICKPEWRTDAGNGGDSLLADAACRNTGKAIVLALDYKEPSTGFCIHHDWTGKYKFDCRVHKALLGGKDPQVLTGSVPTDAYDSRLNYSAYNASCFQSVNHAPGGYWGQCGAFDQSHPSAEQILNWSNAGTMTGIGWTTSDNERASNFNYLGEYVGPGLVSSGPLICKPEWRIDADGGKYAEGHNLLADAVCRSTGKSIVLSLNYKDSTGACFHHDWTGKYKFDCRVMKALLGGKEPQVLTGSVPTDALDTRLNYGAYTALCFQSVNHAPGGYWGQCGAFDQSQPSADWILNNAYSPSSRR